MTKNLFTLIVLLLAAVMTAACTGKPASTAVTVAGPVAELTPTEPAAAPEQIAPTAVPVGQPVMIDEVMTVDNEGNTAVDAASIASALDQIGSAELNDDEINDLLYMREEEKLAHDVYLALYERWGLPVFQNIANSELTHTEAIKTLLVRYELDDPALHTAVGVFTNDALQTLYGRLVAQGNQSLVAALQVGATIEDLDIVDLEKAVARTDNPEIILVYENLMKGSRNHLRSFVSLLQKQGGEVYLPQFLDQAAFEAIVNAPRERGQ